MAIGSPAQQFVAIDSIRENIVALKDGGLRAILMCSSLNFALKSTQEQDAIIFQYQNFLNALDFPIQIVVHSRKINVTPYLESIALRQKEEDNDLLKIQMSEYIEFIKTFVGMTNIMSKTFYIVVPFSPPVIEQAGVFNHIAAIFGLKKKQEAAASDRDTTFEEHKSQLLQRVDAIESGLQHIGVRAAPLETEELIELFYGLYNPTEFEREISAPQEETT